MSDDCEGCEDRIDSMQYEITTLEEDLGGARDRIEALEDELTAALKDAERYRHMRKSAEFQNRNGPGLYWYLPQWKRDLSEGDRLDAAIDAAIAAEKSTKGE